MNKIHTYIEETHDIHGINITFLIPVDEHNVLVKEDLIALTIPSWDIIYRKAFGENSFSFFERLNFTHRMLIPAKYASPKTKDKIQKIKKEWAEIREIKKTDPQRAAEMAKIAMERNE